MIFFQLTVKIISAYNSPLRVTGWWFWTPADGKIIGILLLNMSTSIMMNILLIDFQFKEDII